MPAKGHTMLPKTTAAAPDVDLAKWCQALASVATVPADVVPPGWRTADEIAKATSMTGANTRRSLRLMIERGQAETKKFRIPLGGRPSVATAHFRLK